MNALPPPPGEKATPHGWHWIAPRAGVGLIVAALLGLLWLPHRQELEENRSELIRDVLWVEQSIQFSLERDVEQLRQLAQAEEGPLDPRRLELGVSHLLPSSPGLVKVALLDREGALLASAPGPLPDPPRGPGLFPGSEPAWRLARGTGRVAWSPAHPAPGGDQQLEVFVPTFRAGSPAGAVVGIYSLKSILTGLVPWWLAERHRVTIRDASGAVLAAKSNVQPEGSLELTHQTVLDPPGQGLLLHVESYGSGSKLLRNALVATILGLAVAVLWSLWALRRHIQRRLDIEEALRGEYAFRKAMGDSLETGMRAIDLDGRIVFANPAFCKMVGYSEEELVGRSPPLPFWPAEERTRIEAALQAARLPGAARTGIELELVRRGGARFDALLYEAPLVDAQGHQIGWMGSMLDITDRKQARERARQQEEKLAATARLVTMGEMASAIAHELNQPLSAIASYATGCLNVLETGAASTDEVKGALRKLAQQAQRAGQIIRRVHEFVRKSEPTRSRVRLHAVVEEAVGFAEAEARKRRVKIVAELAEDSVELDADPLLLQQVLLNLLRNGMDAMASTPETERRLVVSTGQGGGTATVRVADRGCGLSAEVQGQLFEPFFSTKPEGMGMGLNICRSIIELHKGRVWAEPNPGGGTVFSFSLPVGAA